MTVFAAGDSQEAAGNLLDPAWGTRLVKAGSTWDGGDYGPGNLLDGDVDTLWRAADGRIPPVKLEYEFARPARISGAAFANAEDADYANAQARIVNVDAFTQSGERKILGTFSLDKSGGLQVVRFGEATCRRVTITIMSNHGSRHMTTLSELALLGELTVGGPYGIVEGTWRNAESGRMVLDQRGETLVGMLGDPPVMLEGRELEGQAWIVRSAGNGGRCASLVVDHDLRLRAAFGGQTGEPAVFIRRSREVAADAAGSLSLARVWESDLEAAGSATIVCIAFCKGSAEFSAGSGKALDELAAFLQDQAGRSWDVEVHTAPTDPPTDAQALSELRAQALGRELVKRGLDESLLTVAGKGGGDPIAPVRAEPWRQLNERIVVRPR